MITHSDSDSIPASAELHVQPFGSFAEIAISFQLGTKTEVQKLIDRLTKIRDEMPE